MPRKKNITLDEDNWLRNSVDIKKHREVTLKKQKGRCRVSGVKLEVGCLDHDHDNGIVRGVLLSEANTLEGRYLSLFKKMKMDSKYGLDFSDFLISLGEYLKEKPTTDKLHHKYMEDFRKKLTRKRKDFIISLLKTDFNIVIDSKTSKGDVVKVYIDNWLEDINNE